MSVHICQLGGCRGRSIDVYDNKCVITTDVTLGSVLTHNALDGKKTIFYIDVTGIQFKRSGMAIGYLQLETSSLQMNNQNSNMFSENTYTFEDGVNNITNNLIQKVHDYIVDRIEGYKYGFEPTQDSLEALIQELKDSGNENRAGIIRSRKEEIRRKEEAERKEKAEQVQKEKIQRIRQAMEEVSGRPELTAFMQAAESCKRIADVKIAWGAVESDFGVISEEITGMIDRAVNLERRYGSGPRDVQELVGSIATFLQGKELQ